MRAVEGANMIEVSGVRVGSGLVSLTVRAGEPVALCGTSAGALLELVAGRRRAENGTVRVDGHDPYVERGRVTVAYLGAEDGLYGELRLDEIIDAWRRWSSSPLDVDDVVALAGLERHTAVPYARLTAGERRRFDLAMIMISRPDALVVDEPATALEPGEARAFWAVIRSLGVPVLVATRSAAEARRASRVLMLDPVNVGRAA